MRYGGLGVCDEPRAVFMSTSTVDGMSRNDVQVVFDLKIVLYLAARAFLWGQMLL